MKQLDFVLPLPPSVNRVYRISPHGFMYLTTEGKAYKEFVSGYVADFMAHHKLTPLDAPSIVMQVWIAWGSAKEQDPANLDKILPDALETVAWVGSDAKLYIQHQPPAIIDVDQPRVYVILSENRAQPIGLPTLPQAMIDWQQEQADKRAAALERKKERKKKKRLKAKELAKQASLTD